MFSIKDWQGMNDDQRLLELQGIETQEAGNQVRPAATVRAKDLGSSQGGYYKYSTNEIGVNISDIQSRNPYEAIDTCYHEGRHAYQYHEAFNEHTSNPKYARLCKEGYENYIQYENDPEGYENQFVEEDARGYAQAKLNEYSQSEGNYHTGLYENTPNKGIEAFRERLQSQNHGVKSFGENQRSQNQGIESFREKSSENQANYNRQESGEGQSFY